jgi:hypothetical protein
VSSSLFFLLQASERIGNSACVLVPRRSRDEPSNPGDPPPREGDSSRTLLTITAATILAGKEDLAHRSAERIRAKFPDLVLWELGAGWLPGAEPWQRYLAALCQAGIPEE